MRVRSGADLPSGQSHTTTTALPHPRLAEVRVRLGLGLGQARLWGQPASQ